MQRQNCIDINDWISTDQPLPESCFFVYRVWRRPRLTPSAVGWHEELLYVGQTNNLRRRLGQHAGHDGYEQKFWANSVGSVTVEIHGSRIGALNSEARAIKNESPTGNFHYSRSWWNCESSYCQVLLLAPWEISGPMADRWSATVAPIHDLAEKFAQPDGDPVVYNAGNFWWLATDLPKVRPNSLECLAGRPGIRSVQSIKMGDFPVPEPLFGNLKRTEDVVQWAPKFPSRDAA